MPIATLKLYWKCVRYLHVYAPKIGGGIAEDDYEGGRQAKGQCHSTVTKVGGPGF